MTSYVLKPLRLVRRYVFGAPMFLLLILVVLLMYAQRGRDEAREFIHNLP